MIYLLALLFVFCGVHLVRDLRRRHFIMAACDALLVIALAVMLATPPPTHAVKLDLIPPSR